MTQRTILVVDDAPINIDCIVGILKGQYKTKAAISGEHALRIAAKEPVPDLILLDVSMPVMDGYEVCQQLKSDATTRKIPVVFVTGKVSPEEERQGMDMGAVGYVKKPVDVQQLLDTLDSVFHSL